MFRTAIYILSFILVSACSQLRSESTSQTAVDSSPEKFNINSLSIEPIQEGEVTAYCYSPDGKDSSLSTISYNYFSQSDSLYKRKVNDLIMDKVVKEVSFSDEPTGDESLSFKFFQTQLTAFSKLCSTETEEDGPLWEIDVNISINNSFMNFSQVSFGSWSYSGGAHGIGAISYYQVDKSTGEELGYDDFFRNIDLLRIRAEEYFRKAYEIGLQEKFSDHGLEFEDDHFRLPANFYFLDDTLYLYYNVYEIGPYVAGDYEVGVPLSMLQELLRINPL